MLVRLPKQNYERIMNDVFFIQPSVTSVPRLTIAFA